MSILTTVLLAVLVLCMVIIMSSPSAEIGLGACVGAIISLSLLVLLVFAPVSKSENGVKVEQSSSEKVSVKIK